MPVGEMGLNGANGSINRGLPAMSAVTETSGELWERVTEAVGWGRLLRTSSHLSGEPEAEKSPLGAWVPGNGAFQRREQHEN